jgi:glycosyltransferase involved in cell wall biosynthesis
VKEFNNICDITFFVPCLNEEDNIEKTLSAIISSVENTSLSYEILIVDDHSIDNSINNISIFQKQFPDILINVQANRLTRGLGRNYVDGAFIGQGKYYMLINGDNAEPKETICTILKQLGTADMIIPYFGYKEDRSLFRKQLSVMFTRLVNLISGNDINYYNGPVAHLRFNVMRWSPDSHGFAYQAELITRILDEGASYKEIEIANYDRKDGTTKAFKIENILSVGHSLLQILLRRVRTNLFYNKSNE